MKTTFLATAFLAIATAAQAQPVALGAPVEVPAAEPTRGEGLADLVVMRSLKTDSFVPPLMNSRLVMAAVSRGRVRIALQVDENGRPMDWLIIAYSHRDLADSTLDVVRRWRFDPVKIENVPVKAQTEFDLDFKGPDVVTISTVSDHIELFMRNLAGERLEYRPCTVRELDRIPLLLNVVTPRYSIAARDQGVRGSVEVQFYIDEKGTVRLPAVLNADRIDIAMAALEAVRQWKFEPPTRNGRPVLISAIQQFDFGMKEPTAANIAK
jgi:TonB family protein